MTAAKRFYAHCVDLQFRDYDSCTVLGTVADKCLVERESVERKGSSQLTCIYFGQALSERVLVSKERLELLAMTDSNIAATNSMAGWLAGKAVSREPVEAVDLRFILRDCIFQGGHNLNLPCVSLARQFAPRSQRLFRVVLEGHRREQQLLPQ
jgi:hypothetical protein